MLSRRHTTKRARVFGGLFATILPVVLILAVSPVHAAEVFRPSCFKREATIVGTSRGELLRGTPRQDVIFAAGGNDIVYALEGNDIVCAGAGDDAVHAGIGADRVKGGPENTGDQLYGERGDDLLMAVSGSFYDFGHADFLYGGRGSDRLIGTDGLDYMAGGWGSDVLRGRGSTDPFFTQRLGGGAGPDRIYGGPFLGHPQENPQQGFVYQLLLGYGGADLLIGGTENPQYDAVVERLWGGRANDTLDGRSGQNTNNGGLGDADVCRNPDTGQPGATACEA